MRSRYYVNYRHLQSETAKVEKKLLGRCWDQDFAEQQARDLYRPPEYEILNVRVETEFEMARYKIFRIAIRTSRIIIAAIITFFAVSWFENHDIKIGDIPIAELTLGMIFSAIFYLSIFIGAIAICWQIAFGDGPEDL